jgi:hypothetical protein
MTHTDEQIKWAAKRLMELSWMPGFPVEDAHIISLARAYLRIVGPTKGNRYEEDGGKDGNGPKIVVVPPKSIEETSEMLHQEILDRCSRFPSPIEMRKIYAEFATPADGRRPGEMLS